MINQTKNLKTEMASGLIVFRRTHEGTKFLLLYHGGGYWNFPKGKIESEEKSFAAALRETREETGLKEKDLRVLDNFKAHERFYFKRRGQPTFKIVIFYLAEARISRVQISREHNGYGWFIYRDAKKILEKYKDSQKVLEQAHSFLRKSQINAGDRADKR